MSISLEEGVSTLQAMFSGVERDVIIAVLESNRGNMERSVDSLLVITGEKSALSPSEERPPTTQRTVVPREQSHSSSLPSDFLSLPTSQPSSREGDFARPEELEQIHNDEMFAKMLQDQMFMNELQREPEFASVFGRPQRSTRTPQDQSEEVQSPPLSPNATSQESPSEFKKKVESLGEAAKSRFSSLSSRFFNRRGSSQSSAQYRSLMSSLDDEDTEVVYPPPQQSSQRASKYQVDSRQDSLRGGSRHTKDN